LYSLFLFLSDRLFEKQDNIIIIIIIIIIINFNLFKAVNGARLRNRILSLGQFVHAKQEE
jgi:hypothetical protein